MFTGCCAAQSGNKDRFFAGLIIAVAGKWIGVLLWSLESNNTQPAVSLEDLLMLSLKPFNCCSVVTEWPVTPGSTMSLLGIKVQLPSSADHSPRWQCLCKPLILAHLYVSLATYYIGTLHVYDLTFISRGGGERLWGYRQVEEVWND